MKGAEKLNSKQKMLNATLIFEISRYKCQATNVRDFSLFFIIIFMSILQALSSSFFLEEAQRPLLSTCHNWRCFTIVHMCKGYVINLEQDNTRIPAQHYLLLLA